jgi:hypothetical protein
LRLKEELKALKESQERDKEIERQKQMIEKIRKEVEDEFHYQMECAKEAQERAREEIEKIKTETEIATRKKILAERHAEAERERLEAQQAIRFEREVRLKIERERVAEEAAREARERQREEYEILMREKMLQSMEELTAMAKGKMMLEIGTEKEPNNKVMDVETNYETVVKAMSVKTQSEEIVSSSGINEYQRSETELEEEAFQLSSDAGDVSEQQTSTPVSESQNLHDQNHFRSPRGTDTTEERDYWNREDLESRMAPEQPSTASIDSDATHFSFGKTGVQGDDIPPPAPDALSISDEDDRNSSSSRGSRFSSYRPRKSRRAYSAYGDHPMDEGQHFYPEYQFYQRDHRHQNSYQERNPYQEYHPEYYPYSEHQDYRGYRSEDYSYPVSNAYPVQMGELVEQIIDGVLSRLQGVPASYSDFQNTQQFPPSEPSPRVETVSSVSASDVESAHSEAATLQSQLSESTRETSIINEHASDARLTIEGRIPLMESNLPNGFETPKSQPQLHVDITAMTVVAVCHDEDEFYTPTESGEPAMNSYFECSIKDTDTYQETNLLQLSS